MSRPLSELGERASLLARVSQKLREECIAIARKKSPSASITEAHRAAMLAGYHEWDREKIAQATRWLALIRRDYSPNEFEQMVRTLTKQQVMKK